MTKKKENKEKIDAYQVLTDQIIQALEESVDSWKCPWNRLVAGPPINMVSKKQYRGINRLVLNLAANLLGSSTFATYKQWKEKDRQVKKGEKGHKICFFKTLEYSDPDESGEDEEKTKSIPMIRISTVFAESQLEDYVPPPVEERTNQVELQESVENLIKTLEIKVENRYRNSAFYRPSEDFINMPLMEDFVGTETSSPTESYYATLLHECVHWTKHSSRCDRKLTGNFGSAEYAKEELVAELGSAFLAQDLGVSTELREDHVQYLNSWLTALKGDKKYIFKASAMAQKAVDWINEHSVLADDVAA